MEPWLESLIGLPYTKEHDCYWLTKLVIKEALGIDLPDSVIGWRKFAYVFPPSVAVEKWDVLCFEGEGHPLGTIGHIGVAIGGGNFIHTGMQYGGAVVDSVERWRPFLLHVARKK